MSEHKLTDGGDTKTKRRVEVRKTDSGHYFADVELTELDYNEQYGEWEPSEPRRVAQFAFVPLDEDWTADRVRGDLPHTDGKPVGYIGSSAGKHYYEPAGVGDLPVDVLEALRDSGLTLLDGFDGGWDNWDGRPEWSESYLDVADAEVVDVARLIGAKQQD